MEKKNTNKTKVNVMGIEADEKKVKVIDAVGVEIPNNHAHDKSKEEFVEK